MQVTNTTKGSIDTQAAKRQRMALAGFTGAVSVVALGTNDSRIRAPSATAQVEKIGEDQRRVVRYKHELKAKTRRAVNALVTIGQQQIVLGHIHPRWLRDWAEAQLDAGEAISFEALAARKALGPTLEN